MRTETAMLPDASSSQDRIFTTPNAVIILDGASAFVPVDVSPSAYVDTLGRFLVEGLMSEPRISLTDVLAQAIEESALLLDLRPGSAPSSTVAIARQDYDALDLLLLGDSQIATPRGVYSDDRIASIGSDLRSAYRSRLAAGHGYDGTHREILRALQVEQAKHRNVDGGYWIAEAAPEAARHAITLRESCNAIPWLVLSTDGAYRPMQHLMLDDWHVIAGKNQSELNRLLCTLHQWEAHQDPGGILLPRAKLHDDMAIASAGLILRGPKLHRPEEQE